MTSTSTQHKTQTFTLLAIRVSPQTNYGLVIPLYRPLHVPDWSGESYFHQVSGQTKQIVAEMRESIFNESCFHPQGGCIRVCVSAETRAPDEAPPVRPVDGSISMTAVGERFCEGLLLPDRSVIVAPRGHFLRLLGDRQYGPLAEFPQVMLDASLLDRDPDRLVESFLRCARQLPNGPRRQRHWDALRLEWLRDGDESTVPLPQYDDICRQIR